jgi:hypothetical protein
VAGVGVGRLHRESVGWAGLRLRGRGGAGLALALWAVGFGADGVAVSTGEGKHGN